MNTARYVIGVLLLMALPPGVFLWFVIHPLARYWRRFGAIWTYVVLSPMVVGWMCFAFVTRNSLLGRDLGTHFWLLAPAAFSLLGGIVIARKRRRHLTNKVVAGLPELSPDTHERKLITSGIYSRIRHPRYVELLLGTSAYAFFSNHVGVYVAAALAFPALFLVVVIEEKELRERFGTEYDEYCTRVPRFLPVKAAGEGS